MKSIGILGGTFDPVHNGHLRMALEVYQSLDLTEIRLVPLHIPSHRDRPIASSEQRLAMLRSGIKMVDGLVVDDCELKRSGTSYTLDTVMSLREVSSNQPLCLIMGMDAFQALHTWYKWTLLLDYVHIIVVDRSGNEPVFKQREIDELFSKNSTDNHTALLQAPAGKILKLTPPMLDISSTRIRELIASGKNIRYLLSDKVISYIQQQDLYCRPA